MKTFISTIKFTEQGMKNITATCQRAEAFRTVAERMGVKINSLFWTLGEFDGLVVFDAPDEETATALMLNLGSSGNVQTRTVRAYHATEMEQVLGKLPE